ncbi:MAG: VOC family protein [Anaerolineae bacterium]|jgi:predicted enzyme related to lactoylglutathione lyase
MALKARYVHTNLVAADWQRLAQFYQEVFGCQPVPPERDLSGPWLEDATGIAGARIRGVHLRLPGHGDTGPTLEIFQYDPDRFTPDPARVPDRPGLGHLAFLVEDVREALAQVMAAGGGAVGKTVSAEISGAGRITFVYATDPEGNIIELQQWTPLAHSRA